MFLFSNLAWNLEHFEGCYMSVAWKIILAYCLIISVFTLKMHKNDLEKNCSHLQLMSLSSRGTLTPAETWGKVPTRVLWGLFFYRVRQFGSFKVLLVFFSTFLFQILKYPTLVHWLASWASSLSKTHFHGLPTTYHVPHGQISWHSMALNFLLDMRAVGCLIP